MKNIFKLTFVHEIVDWNFCGVVYNFKGINICSVKMRWGNSESVTYYACIHWGDKLDFL